MLCLVLYCHQESFQFYEELLTFLLGNNLKRQNLKGAVHILGEICPRSDPDIAHMGYYPDPINSTPQLAGTKKC